MWAKNKVCKLKSYLSKPLLVIEKKCWIVKTDHIQIFQWFINLSGLVFRSCDFVIPIIFILLTPSLLVSHKNILKKIIPIKICEYFIIIVFAGTYVYLLFKFSHQKVFTLELVCPTCDQGLTIAGPN